MGVDDLDGSEAQVGVQAFGRSRVLPQSLAVDISFVASCLDPQDADHRECSAYLERLTDAGTVLFFTDLTELQLHDLARALQAVERPDASGSRPLGRGGLALLPPTPEDVFDRWRTLVASTEAMYCEIPEVIEGTWAVMAAHDIDATRAASVSLAKVTEADGLVTTDPAFAAVASATLPIFVPGRVADAILREQMSTEKGAHRD